jgi:hypothetical protein
MLCRSSGKLVGRPIIMLEKLRGRLLLVASGIAAVGCGSSDPGTGGPTVSVPTSQGSAKPTSTVAARPKATAGVIPALLPSGWVSVPPPQSSEPTFEPGQPRLPSCPSGRICAHQATAKAEHREGNDELGACPATLLPRSNPDSPASPLSPGKSTPEGGWFPQRHETIRLDEELTSSARSEGKSDACCYNWFQMCAGGRPLVVAGASRLASAIMTNDWA